MYYYTVIIIAVIIIGAAAAIYNFAKMGRDQQIKNIKQWLLYAVIDAERLLGSNTGKIKLRFVYDMFISKFKFMSYIISFDTFSMLVDEVLEEMRSLIETNDAVKAIVESDK